MSRHDREVDHVAVWRSYHCDTRYSISECADDGEEIRCVGGADDMDEAWEEGCEHAEDIGVEARLLPDESGRVTRRQGVAS